MELRPAAMLPAVAPAPNYCVIKADGVIIFHGTFDTMLVRYYLCTGQQEEVWWVRAQAIEEQKGKIISRNLYRGVAVELAYYGTGETILWTVG